MSGRPDDGYQVRSRIDGRSGRGNRALLSILVLLAGAWLAVTLVNRAPTTATASPSAPVGTAQAPEDSAVVPTADVVPTKDLPPLISAFPGAPTEPFPVLVGNLAWVQPAMSAIVGDVDAGWTEWPFVFTDGTSMCVCLEPREQNGTTNILRLLRYDANGQLTTEGRFFDWVAGTTDEPFLLDAELSPSTNVVFIVTAVRGETGWSIRLDSVGSTIGDGRNSIDLGEIPLANLPDGQLRGLSVWVAPDGEHVLVAARSLPPDAFTSGPSLDLRWLIGTGEQPHLVDADFPVPGWQDRRCFPQGWATAVDFVTVCVLEGEQESTVLVRRDSVDGTTDEIIVGTAPDPGVINWLLDGTNGRLFGWNPISLEVMRIQLPTLAVVARTIDPPADGMPLDPEAALPAPGPDPVRWSAGELDTRASPDVLTGSVDGRALYAAGFDATRIGPRGIRTGWVFVFDTEALRLVAAWEPAGTYIQLGTSVDGAYVLAAGEPADEEIERFGNQGPQLVVHDAVTGRVVLILRRMEERLGGVPSFLTPQPAPVIRFGVP